MTPPRNSSARAIAPQQTPPVGESRGDRRAREKRRIDEARAEFLAKAANRAVLTELAKR